MAIKIFGLVVMTTHEWKTGFVETGLVQGEINKLKEQVDRLGKELTQAKKNDMQRDPVSGRWIKAAK